MIWIFSLVFCISVIMLGVQWTALQNDRMRDILENWDIENASLELTKIHQDLFRRESDWKPVLAEEGVTVSVRWSQKELVGKNVRTYRTVSRLHADQISVDRILELLDGGFLTEELWYKEDYQGGERLRELLMPGLASCWVPRYISDLKFPPFKLRDFVYLLMRKELEPTEFARVTDKSIVRQSIIGYRSIPYLDGSGSRVRAQQFPSLDRITLCEDGEIIWEHIMVFHLGGNFPLWLTNVLVKPAARVLLNEALNMRKHSSPKSLPSAA